MLNDEARRHWKQSDRLAALKSYRILDTPPEAEFDDLVRRAARTCAAPIGLISFFEERRQFKAEVGLGLRETPLDWSLCIRALLQPGLTIVRDLAADPRFNTHPLVTGEPHLRFYAGAVLETPDGFPIGIPLAFVCCATFPRNPSCQTHNLGPPWSS